ncbi:hypothetical protein ACFL6W_05675 [Thermodesulfobacteriota bacterium]
MPYSRHVDEDGILITTLSGVVTLNELIELQNKLHNYAQYEEIYELVIHPTDVEIVLESKESEFSADNVKIIMRKFKRGAIAFVSNKDFVYGILRQLQMRAENEYIQMSVFKNEETALKWLKEMKASSKANEGED